jgi:glucans biosynthesis protein C
MSASSEFAINSESAATRWHAGASAGVCAATGAGPAAGAAPRYPADRTDRRHDMDWLRVLAFMLLVPYHTGMLFVSWDWHIKNPQVTNGLLEVAMFFMAEWRLPLLFFVSGAGVWFALRRRTPGEFVRERLRRLLLPLAVGMLVVVPPQVYFERLEQGAGYASFLHYLPDAFSGVYPAGNLSWHHLWFVAYVLVFALIALPLFLRLRAAAMQPAYLRFVALLERRGMLLLLAVPVAVGEILLRPAWPTTHNLVADWANFVSSLCVFVAGYLICSCDRLWVEVERQRRDFLLLGSVASLMIILTWQLDAVPEMGYSVTQALWRTGRVLSSWAWVLALAGYARRYLNIRSRAISLANEAVYPFYILHQLVTVMLGFHITKWNLGIAAKFTLVMLGTYLITAALYLLVRSNPLTRLLFGMKPYTRHPVWVAN